MLTLFYGAFVGYLKLPTYIPWRDLIVSDWISMDIVNMGNHHIFEEPCRPTHCQTILLVDSNVKLLQLSRIPFVNNEIPFFGWSINLRFTASLIYLELCFPIKQRFCGTVTDSRRIYLSFVARTWCLLRGRSWRHLTWRTICSNVHSLVFPCLAFRIQRWSLGFALCPRGFLSSYYYQSTNSQPYGATANQTDSNLAISLIQEGLLLWLRRSHWRCSHSKNKRRWRKNEE